MVLVDTNIVGNLLLNGPNADAARALFALDADWCSEPLLLVELTNVLATSMRAGLLELDTAQFALQTAHGMMDQRLYPTPDADVLAVAHQLGVSGYDARFLCLAIALGTPLVTEDAKLRRKAPALTVSLADALADAQSG